MEPRAAKARLFASAGQITLAATGLGALALIAVGAQALWHAEPARPGSVAVASLGPSLGLDHRQGTGGEGPRIWLSSLSSTGESPFAAPDYALDPVLPRRQPGASRPHAAVASAPVEAAPAPAAAATAPGPRAEPQPVPQIATREGPPRVTPPRRPAPVATAAVAPEAAAATPEAPADPQALAALHAPTRSLLPRPRPALAAPAAEEPAPEQSPSLFAAIGEATGLIRSRTPQPRPETVTRLASLDLGRTTTDTPRAAPAVLEIPALTRGARSASCDADLTRAIPRRSRGAGDGSAVIGRLSNAGGRERDNAIISEVLAGNVPDFLRDLVPVTFAGNGMTITICVTPDYLSVGSDRDFVRVPLGLPAAMQVAERFDMVLPTTRMVDAIYQQANVHLSPAPMDPTSAMSSTNYFLRHNATVQGQMRQSGARLGQLVSGHKKDLVLTNRLQANPGRVAIYGWHQRNGRAIQPLSTVHGAQYADYSHGIRLVSRRAYVNGRAVDLRDLLSDSRMAGLVSSEGTISNRQLLALAD